MATLIVLFNLKAETDLTRYERWAVETDIPTVRRLSSCSDFSVYRSTGVLGSEDTPPYQYIEIIQIEDMDEFGKDVASETMQRVAEQFQGFADNPTFIMTEALV